VFRPQKFETCPDWGAGSHTKPDEELESKKLNELLHRESGFKDQNPECTFGKFFVVGNNRQASARRVGIAARNNRQFHPMATSMTSSSSMPGGTGSPCLSRLMR